MLSAGIARVGKDPVVRYTQDNKAVLDLSLAFSYGRKGQDGKQPTQWVDASFWGVRAEKVAPYIQKGKQLYVQLSDLHIENYTKKDGTAGSSLKGVVQELELIGNREESAPEPHKQFAAPSAANGVNELEDDIPF